MVSSVTSTWSIRFSTLTAVLIPCLNDYLFVLNNQTTNVIQLAWAEPMVPCEHNGRQPELGVLPVATHVDVPGLVAVETVEKEPVRPGNARNPRHVSLVANPMISSSSDSAKSG